MKIIVDNSGEYNDVVSSYYNLMKHNDDSGSEVLFQGYNTSCNMELKNKYSNYIKRAYLNLEAPCSFVSSQTSIADQKYFTHVYTICPYTAEWLNNKTNTKFIPIPFPISLNAFKDIIWDKEFDVIYTGTLFNSNYYDIINVMKNFKYIFTSLVNYSYPYNPTHVNIGSVDKWKLISKSKISVCINQAHYEPSCAHCIVNIKSYGGWEESRAFTQIHNGIIPQFKSRITEAMGLKTLNLVKKDEWNVIETWFKPDVHFIYWDNNEDLKEKMANIINNYGQFQHIIENAYEEVKKYDIDNIYKNIISK